MIKTTAMLHNELQQYANPAVKIKRMADSRIITPIIKGIYETDASTPGHYLAGIIYGPSYLSFEYHKNIFLHTHFSLVLIDST